MTQDKKPENKNSFWFNSIAVLIALLALLRDFFDIKIPQNVIGDFLNDNSWFTALIVGAATFFVGLNIRKSKNTQLATSPTIPTLLPETESISQSPIFPKSQELVESIDSIIDKIDDSTKNIIISLFNGWFKQLISEVEHGGNQSFDIDSDYYENCLLEIESEDIYAIADLSTDVENFWLENPSPDKTKVQERIFLIDWRDFFDQDKLHKFLKTFKSHSQLYNIRIGHVPVGLIVNIHDFPNKIGHHLFLGIPNLVGGYIKEGSRMLLRMTRNEKTYKQAQSVYEDIKSRTFAFEKQWNINELRKAWIKQNKIGYWKPEWGDLVEDRTPDYFAKYDMHIRCWIPRYDDFIKGAFELIKLNTLTLFREQKHKLKILEIGFGTGALTKFIIDWIALLDLPLKGTKNSVSYYGIDRAKKEMLTCSQYGIKEGGRGRNFFEGSAFDSIPSEVLKNKPYDIICASLVLHDLNTENPKPNFRNVLMEVNKLIRENGRFIIADLYGTSDRKKQNERFEYWRKTLKNNLSDTETQVFLDKNKDMVNCIMEEDVLEISAEYGFRCEFYNPKKGNRNSPFKYLVLIKEKENTAANKVQNGK